MVSLEKLTLFNIDEFRELYDISHNSYICDNDFFKIYDDESFIVKYIIRKQVKLFKSGDRYVGYIWFEYPSEDNISSIYSLYIENDYMEHIDYSAINSLNFDRNILKFDALQTSDNINMARKFNFQVKYETVLMHAKSSHYSIYSRNITFRHFKKKCDEKLRCTIQNAVFNEKSRIPLNVNDIYAEEDEHYYLDDFGVFIFIDSDTPIGYGQVILNRDTHTIVNLGILEEYRGQGYGESLLQYLLGLCYDRGISDVYIRVEKENIKALSLYKKAGFVEESYITTWISS